MILLVVQCYKIASNSWYKNILPYFWFLVENVNDFSSKEAMERNGWSFMDIGGGKWSEDSVFSSGDKFCKDVTSASYCGYKYPGDGVVSYTFPYPGTATLMYGQSWDTGSVHVKKNGKEIDSRRTRGSSSVTFDFTSGDILNIVELGNSVINIHQLTLTRSGEKKTKSISLLTSYFLLL